MGTFWCRKGLPVRSGAQQRALHFATLLALPLNLRTLSAAAVDGHSAYPAGHLILLHFALAFRPKGTGQRIRGTVAMHDDISTARALQCFAEVIFSRPRRVGVGAPHWKDKRSTACADRCSDHAPKNQRLESNAFPGSTFTMTLMAESSACLYTSAPWASLTALMLALMLALILLKVTCARHSCHLRTTSAHNAGTPSQLVCRAPPV